MLGPVQMCDVVSNIWLSQGQVMDFGAVTPEDHFNTLQLDFEYLRHQRCVRSLVHYCNMWFLLLAVVSSASIYVTTRHNSNTEVSKRNHNTT